MGNKIVNVNLVSYNKIVIVTITISVLLYGMCKRYKSWKVEILV